jgi:hypothetical protein
MVELFSGDMGWLGIMIVVGIFTVIVRLLIRLVKKKITKQKEWEDKEKVIC